MKRRIITFGRYFGEFMEGLTVKEREKVDYGLVLFNGFQKKTQKTPVSEITKSYISRIENGESALAIVTTNYYLHHSIAFKAL
jgi:hypothetical protein